MKFDRPAGPPDAVASEANYDIRINDATQGDAGQETDAMRIPSFSIAEIMAIVAFAALDCLEIRAARSSPTLRCLIFGSLPMQNALLVGLLLMVQRRRRMEQPLAFLVGFEAVGWISLLIYVAVCVQATESLTWHLTCTLTPLLSATGFPPYSTADYICRYGLAMSYLTAPQLVTALVAGWINQCGPSRPAAPSSPVSRA